MIARSEAVAVFRAGIEAVGPCEAVRGALSLGEDILVVKGEGGAPTMVPLAPAGRVLVLGAGKAGEGMTRGVLDVLGDRVVAGAVAIPGERTARLSCVDMLPAGHPLPTEGSLHAASVVMDLARNAGPDDLCLVLLSGGGSALLALPAEGVTLHDKVRTVRALLSSGASIREINVVRKHLSAVKGGWLAARLAPCPSVTLAMSDVIGDDPSTIASGPTVPDPSTFRDALGIVDRYHLGPVLPDAVMRRLQEGVHGRREETPKADSPVFGHQTYAVIASNQTALSAMRSFADGNGWQGILLPDMVRGQARTAARDYVSMLRQIRAQHQGRLCVLSGGETTVRVVGPGRGGRNQEFALAASLAMAGWPDVLLLSAGTDGVDGPTPAAGAFADGSTVERARAIGIDPGEYLEQNDAFSLFERLGDAYVTGPTGTNVMDVQIALLA